MSTVLLTDDRQQSASIHPPDTGDREILSIPDHDELRRLAFADRLSLRLGLWLLHRSLAGAQASGPPVQDSPRHALDERVAIAQLAYGLLQRSLL